jgi:hypothetical protein
MGHPPNLRILSWNILDPGASFLGGVNADWHAAKTRHKPDFISWANADWHAAKNLNVDELVFVENPKSDCIESKKNDDGSWYSEFLSAGDDFTDPSCRLKAIRQNGVWLWKTKWSTSEHQEHAKTHHIPPWESYQCVAYEPEDHVTVAVFEGQYCGHQIPPTEDSMYSQNRMELVNLFLWQCLTSRKKGQNISADIICLQEVPVSFETYFKKDSAAARKLYFSQLNDGILTIVKKKIMKPGQNIRDENKWHDRWSLLDFELSDAYKGLLQTDSLTVINCHAYGGDRAEPYFKQLLKETQWYNTSSYDGLTIMTGDFNMNLQDYSDAPFHSLLLGNKGIEASGILERWGYNPWKLTDVKGNFDLDDMMNDYNKIKRKLKLVNINTGLLDSGAMSDFSSRPQHAGYLLMDYVTNGNDYNFRGLSDHAPLLAEVQLDSEGAQSHVDQASAHSFIYKLFQAYRMDASAPEGRSSSESPRWERRGLSTSRDRDRRGRFRSHSTSSSRPRARSAPQTRRAR